MSLPVKKPSEQLPPPISSVVQSLRHHMENECPRLLKGLRAKGNLQEFLNWKASEYGLEVGTHVENGVPLDAARELAYQNLYPESELHPRQSERVAVTAGAAHEVSSSPRGLPPQGRAVPAFGSASPESSSPSTLRSSFQSYRQTKGSTVSRVSSPGTARTR